MGQYEYDVFISYRRRDPVMRWFLRQLRPLLEQWLGESMRADQDAPPRSPKVFVDQDDVMPGTPWPDKLAKALSRSRCLLPIWSPSYFASEWCVAELESFLERQRVIEQQSAPLHRPLFWPIVYCNPEALPPHIRAIQHRDFSKHRHIERNTVTFKKDVEALAAELAACVRAAPPWQDWPVKRPALAPRLNTPMSRLG